MPDNQNAAPTEQSSTVSAPDWSLLNNLSNSQDVVVEEPKVETPEQKQNTDVVESEQVKPGDEIKVEAPAEKKEEKPAEEKKEPTINPEFEIKVEDIKGAPKAYEKGDWRGIAQELGIELAENSVDKLKELIVSKTELEKASKQSKEQLLASFKPETATAFEMLELGVPEELIFQPTKQIDENISQIDSLIKLSDAELYRKVLENTQGMTPEDIDTEMEDLVSSGRIAHKARMERIALHEDKNTLTADRTKVLEMRDGLLAKQTADRQRVVAQQKEQEISLFTKTLNDKSDFMGIPIPKEVKDAVSQKFRGGLYENDLKEAQSKVDFILYKELGPKFTDLLKKSALAKGREEVIVKQANIPLIQNAASGSRSVDKSPNESKDHPFAIISEDFK